MYSFIQYFLICSLGLLLPITAHAETSVELPLQASLSTIWGIPFVGILLSIAIFPLVAPSFWHRHFGKISLFWAIAFILPFTIVFGLSSAVHVFLHAIMTEYIPFIMLLAALYVVAGGICIKWQLPTSALANTAWLALGGLLASIMGTTGAAILLIRPLLRANQHRKHYVHVVIFFIFIVGNIGGALTPLGDPPLFLGFLNGIGFFWTTTHLFLPMLFICVLLLSIFYIYDQYQFSRYPVGNAQLQAANHLANQTEYKAQAISSENLKAAQSRSNSSIFDGKINFILLAGVVITVLASGIWKTPNDLIILGNSMRLSDLIRNLVLLIILFISLWLTPASARRENEFNWDPILEVAKLFFSIFITIAPVIMMLKEGQQGAFASLIHLLSNADGEPLNFRYFWITGVLSAFLDNAPTYLVFFNMAGGNPSWLMEAGALTLMAISAGSVFLGALTYIGNAPNFMVKAIAESQGIKMPSFFGYMVWSGLILIPILIAVSLIFF